MGREVRDRLEFRQRLAADALAGRIRRDEVGKLLLDVEQFVVEPVVGLIGNGRLGLDVIGLVVAAQFLDQFGVACFGFCVSHGANLVFLILIQTRIGISLFLTGNAGKKNTVSTPGGHPAQCVPAPDNHNAGKNT